MGQKNLGKSGYENLGNFRNDCFGNSRADSYDTIKRMNYGYIKSKWDDKNYCLGGNKLPEEIINPDGDWTGSLPTDEPQQIGFDTLNCTGFGLTNALEIQHKFLYKSELNLSDRYLGIKAGTFPPGNNPQMVAEAARNGGLIPEAFLPFSPDLQNVNEY